VPLYDLPEISCPDGYRVLRPLPHRSPEILEMIEREFSPAWRAESSVALARTPCTMKVICPKDPSHVLAFCCWDCTAKGFLGPVGVLSEARGMDLGRAVVLSTLYSMREDGYAYAVVGGAGPVEFFRKICDARPIEGSDPGIYGR